MPSLAGLLSASFMSTLSPMRTCLPADFRLIAALCCALLWFFSSCRLLSIPRSSKKLCWFSATKLSSPVRKTFPSNAGVRASRLERALRPNRIRNAFRPTEGVGPALFAGSSRPLLRTHSTARAIPCRILPLPRGTTPHPLDGTLTAWMVGGPVVE